MGVDIAVVASFVIESAVVLSRIPVLGESIKADKYYMAPGGKGTNQAVTAARQGKTVGIVAKVGKDLFGQMAINLYESEGISSKNVFITDLAQTAIGLVFVQHTGDNCTGIYMGANELLTAKEVRDSVKSFMPAKVVTAQLESPDDAILSAFQIGKEYGATTLLNPAPVRSFDEKILALTDVITPNECEAKMLTGHDPNDESINIETIAKKIIEMGVKSLVITLGEKGSMVMNHDSSPIKVRPYKVNAVDTLGAGDCFSGSLATGLSEGKSLINSARWASVAAALSTLGNGGTSPLPARKHIEDHFKLYEKER
ncbi:MAG: ribokinase [Holosporales bacterium]|jgi:ribokinase|nr:ribokinase [Holosporales bacterium]